MSYRLSEPFEVSTLLELLHRRAQHQPNQQAYSFLADGETTALHLTYSELDRQARAIGALLQSIEAPGSRDPGARSSAHPLLPYTLGPAAEPKGVMLTDGNLLHHAALIHRRFAH